MEIFGGEELLELHCSSCNAPLPVLSSNAENAKTIAASFGWSEIDGKLLCQQCGKTEQPTHLPQQMEIRPQKIEKETQLFDSNTVFVIMAKRKPVAVMQDKKTAEELSAMLLETGVKNTVWSIQVNKLAQPKLLIK